MGKRNKERIIPFGIELKRQIEKYLASKRENNFSSEFLISDSKNRKITPSKMTFIVKILILL